MEISNNDVLTVQPQIGMVLCSPCQMFLGNPRSANPHLQNFSHGISKHEIRTSIKSIFSEAAEKQTSSMKSIQKNYLSAPYLRSDYSKCDPLPLLKGVRVEEGYGCHSCLHFSKSSQMLSEHIRSKHRNDDKSSEELLSESVRRGTVLLQTIKMGNQTSYFPVFSDDDDFALKDPQDAMSEGKERVENVSSTTIDAFKEILSRQTVVSNTRSIPLDSEDRRSLNDFIFRTRLDRVLSKAGITFGRALILSGRGRSGTLNVAEKRLCEMSKSYMKICPDIIDSFSPSILLNFSPSNDHAFQPVSANTLDSYAQILGRFVVSAYRHFKEGLLPICSASLSNLFSVSESDSFFSEEAADTFHSAIKELCLVRKTEMEGVEGLFVRSFLACNSVSKESGVDPDNTALRFCHSNEVSVIAASLQYCIIFVALLELWRTRERCNSENRNAEERKVISQRVENDLIESLNVKKNTAASYVRFVLNICNNQKGNRTAQFRFVKCDRHQLCGFLNGTELSMEGLGRFVRKWQTRAREIIKKDLLLGGEFPPLHESILASLKDDLNDLRVGYSFMEDSMNKAKIISLSAHVIATIRKNGKGSNSVFIENQEGTGEESETLKIGEFRLSRGGVERWLGKAQELQKLLLACMHVSSGSPGRATELSNHTICNTPLAPRAVYIAQSRIYLLCRYSKQRQVRGKDKPILRLPDQCTSELLKQYFVLFRKVEALFVGALYGSDSEQVHMESVFVNRGEACSAETSRQAFRQKLKTEGKDMGIANYRNHSAAMVRLIARRSASFVQEIIDEYASCGHEQAGHSMSTADNIYGRSSCDFHLLPAEDVNRYKAWALDYHRALFCWEGREVVQKLGEYLGVSECEGKPGRNENGLTEENGITAGHLLRSLSEKVDNLENVFRLFNRKRSLEDRDQGDLEKPHCHVEKRSRRDLVEGAFSLLKPPQRNTEKDAQMLMSHFRKMMKDEDAVFRSQLQADICATMLECDENMLVTAGTGFGKTICFLLPVFIAGPAHCSILVIPLKALEDEMMRRCDLFGIPACTWKHRNRQDAQLVICTPEQVGSESFKIFARNLMIHDKLKWLIFDEAHLSSLWEDFRDKMRDMRYGLSCVPKRVKRVLFSATVPPCDRENVLEAHGITSSFIFAADTMRRNLKLSVRVVREAVGEKAGVSALIRELLRILGEKEKLPERIMVFAMTKASVQDVAEKLGLFYSSRNVGATVLIYHGGLSEEERLQIQVAWTELEKPKGGPPCAIVCTAAFGAGVDARNVRETYHIGGSSSLVQFAQEIGRSGRDGKTAKCVVLYSQAFADSHSSFLRYKVEQGDIFNRKLYEEKKLWLWNDFVTWASDRNICLKRALFEYTDGRTKGMCLYDSTSENCCYCEGIAQTFGISKRVSQETVALSNQSRMTAPREPAASAAEGEIVKDPVETRKDEMERSNLTRRSGQDSCEEGNWHVALPKKPEEAWLMYERTSRQFRGLCVCCLGRARKEVKAAEGIFCDECEALFSSGCYRCLSAQQKTSKCPLPRWEDGHCPICGLRKFPGGPEIHIGGRFGKKCSWVALNKMFWALWRTGDPMRERILNEIFGDNDALAFRKKVVSSGGPDSDEILTLLHKWLYNRKGIPNHVLVLL